MLVNKEAFTAEQYGELFSLHHDKEIEFAEQLISGLQKIDRALLPLPRKHIFQEAISTGSSAVNSLLEKISNGGKQEKFDAVDALSQILLRAPLNTEQALVLRSLLKEALVAEDKTMVPYLQKTLAIGQDAAFIKEQMKYLADEDPAMVATAARLLGFAREKKALPILLPLLSPERIYESRYVIWAIGEIASEEAIGRLKYSIDHNFRNIDCLIALGKIGSVTAIPHILTFMQGEIQEQRDAAYRALAMILDKNREAVVTLKAFKRDIKKIVLEQFEDKELLISGATRFHMLLCLARLGIKLDAALIRRYLKLPLDAGRMSGVQSFRTR